MNGSLRLVAGGAVAAAALVGLRLLSFAPYGSDDDSGAVLRLAWRARGERVRECRELSPEEVAKLPAHMREDEVCERRLIPYRLLVALDSVRLVDRLVHGAGARQDRPLYVFQDLSLQPGRHRVSISFTLETTPQTAPPEAAEHEGVERHEHEHPRAPGAPSRVTLDTTVDFRSRRVLLVTYDEEREQLSLRSGSER